jgi:putative glutathione S-transferase
MPNLWAYARDLYSIPAFGENTDFDQIKAHYYVVQSDINPSGIIPRGPDPAVWSEPHGRG